MVQSFEFFAGEASGSDKDVLSEDLDTKIPS